MQTHGRKLIIFAIMTDDNEILRRLNALESGQVLIVRQVEGSLAKARYFVNGCLAGECEAYIGKNGLGKEREGDGKTPVGVLGVKGAFGTGEKLGILGSGEKLGILGTGEKLGVLPYVRITPQTCACDSEGPFYNLITEEDVPGERMCDFPMEYEFGLETDFNRECIYPLGSAIFIHCKGPRTWTGGCVALDREMMRLILSSCGPEMKIMIL